MLKRNEVIEKEEKSISLSVIISAKNEARNLQKFLPLILEQNYPNFELIVADDASTDETENILRKFQKTYPNLKVLDIEKENGDVKGKKNALSHAITSAEYNYLVFTDADCYPDSENWLRKIIGSYSENTEIVIGFGTYEKRKGFLNKLIRFETLFNAMQYMSYALSGFPYMGVGRNLSYKKTLWLKNKGFSGHEHILSGDDDLFINAAANKKNIAILTDPESKTISIPKECFKDYVKQKKRHLSTGKYYKIRHKFLLGTEILSRFIFYSGIIIFSVVHKFVLIAIILYVIRIFVLLIFTKIFSDKLKEKQNLFFIPIFDILIPLLNLLIYSGTFFDKKIVWK